ncbi:MAG: transcription termination/antitermination protein NusA [bacterium]|nr:transcription termination/antitermination protein NusA [bacterium]
MQTGHELLQTIDTVAKERSIAKHEVFTALEQAIQKAARGRYGQEYDIRATLDPITGEFSLRRCQEIVESVEELEDGATQIILEEAKSLRPDAEVGEFIEEPLPPVDFRRVAAQTARQVIFQGVREAERGHQYEEFKDRVGEIISGIVKRVEFGNVIVDLGRAEGLLHRNEIIPREAFRPGDRVRTYIMDVRLEPRGSQIFLSRSHPQFLAELFKQEVPEIYDGLITIKSVARDPGSRAKMAVYAADPAMDPVGACVGMRGSRVQAVVNELYGEKVDIIPWSEGIPTFIVNALIPAEVSKVVLDEENARVEVVVAEDQLSLAIGRRGQNVRLASKLTELDIDIISEAEEVNRRNQEIKERSILFVEVLDVDDVIAHLLAGEGFETIEDISLVPLEELTTVEGFDEEIAAELQERANTYLKEESDKAQKICKKLGVSEDLTSLEGVTWKMAATLGENDIKTRDNLADLAGDELVEVLGINVIDVNTANEMIMTARAHWFEEKEEEGSA